MTLPPELPPRLNRALRLLLRPRHSTRLKECLRIDRIDVITGVQRRRRYTAEEKAAMVAQCIIMMREEYSMRVVVARISS